MLRTEPTHTDRLSTSYSHTTITLPRKEYQDTDATTSVRMHNIQTLRNSKITINSSGQVQLLPNRLHSYRKRPCLTTYTVEAGVHGNDWSGNKTR